MADINVLELRERFSYCPITDTLVWRYHELSGGTFNARYAGREVHVLIWVLFYGHWPEGTIDHKNHIRNDNRISNLRDIPAGKQKHNLTGHGLPFGVYWEADRERWKAQIKYQGRTVNLGRFKDYADAAEARIDAEIHFGFHPNHGLPM